MPRVSSKSERGVLPQEGSQLEVVFVWLLEQAGKLRLGILSTHEGGNDGKSGQEEKAAKWSGKERNWHRV